MSASCFPLFTPPVVPYRRDDADYFPSHRCGPWDLLSPPAFAGDGSVPEALMAPDF